MFGGKIGWMELVIVLVIALLFFGPSKLGDLGKGLGDAIKNFKGAMKEGEVVLVDDGSCPKGQIKRIVGGNHVKAGGYKQIVRTRSCVPR